MKLVRSECILVIFAVGLFFSFKSERPEKSSDALFAAELFEKLGIKYKEAGKTDSSQLYLSKAYNLYKSSGNQGKTATCLYYLGCAEEQKNRNIEALQYFAEANSVITRYKVMGTLWADVLYKMGRQYFLQNNFDRAYHLFNSCLLESEHRSAADSTMARTIRAKGLIEYYKGDYRAAITSLQKSVDWGIKAFGKYSLFVSDQANNIGVMAFMIGNYDEALVYYKQSESIMKQGHLSSAAGLAGTYINIGLIFKEKNDFESALQFFNKGLEMLLENPQITHTAITNVYLNIGATCRFLKVPKDQFQALTKALYFSKKYNPNLLPKVYQALSIYYTDIKNYDKAEQYYRYTINCAQKIIAEGPDVAYYYNNYGEFQAIRKNYVKSFNAFQKAIPLYLKLFGPRNPSTSSIYYNLSNHFVEVNSYDSALYYIHKAIIANTRTFNNPNVFSNPEPDQPLSSQSMVEQLELKAKILNVLSNRTKQRDCTYKYLELGWKTYRLALDMIDKIRLGYLNEESRLFLYENEQKTYIDAINCALKLYKITQKQSFLEQAFIIADKAHASGLQSTIREKEISKNSIFTDTSLILESKLKKDLSFYQELILKEQSVLKPDTAKIKFWTSKTTDLTFQLANLINQLKVTKPAWYQYKYRTNDNEFIRHVRNNMNDNEIILEYFYSDSALYSFCLSRQSIKYQIQPLPATFDMKISEVLSFVRNQKVYISDSTDYMSYRRSASELYNMLVKTYENDIKNKNLIIIPFEKLTYLPFETLLTHETISKSYNFKELPYLIKQHPIRYLYASNLINIRTSDKSNHKMMAFAPSYPGPRQNLLTAKASQRNSLGLLEETMNEVKTISKYFPGEIFSSNTASEENFKKRATHYGILHLAMHALIEDEDPMYSRLVFTPNSSRNADDDLLYTYEIQRLQLDADLVVLSACNTGIGKLRKGEGMMSLTRGFAFAGIPSIAMTLWSVNDNSSFSLMKNFYHNLSKNYNKDDAMRNAKLEYINNTDIIHSHPYYWAGYVLVGDNSHLKKPGNLLFTISIFSSLLIFVTSIWLVRKRLHRRPIQN